MGLPLTWSHFFCVLLPPPTLVSIALSNLLSKLQFSLNKSICKNLSLLTKQSQLAWGKLCFCPSQSSSHLKLSQRCLKPDRNGRKIDKLNWSKMGMEDDLQFEINALCWKRWQINPGVHLRIVHLWWGLLSVGCIPSCYYHLPVVQNRLLLHHAVPTFSCRAKTILALACCDLRCFIDFRRLHFEGSDPLTRKTSLSLFHPPVTRISPESKEWH